MTLISPTPIWSIDFILASASPAFLRLRCRLPQIAESGPPRNSSSLVIMAHSMRAILFASAMAASILGLRATMRPSHELSDGGRALAPEITAMAPMISRRRMSRCPDLLVRPSLGLPPLEMCIRDRHGCASLSTALHLVEDGFGIGLLPVPMCERAVDSGRLFRIPTERSAALPELVFSICHMPNQPRTLMEDIRDAAVAAAEQASTMAAS